MKKNLIYIVLIFGLTGCAVTSTGRAVVGNQWSPAWIAFTTEQEKIDSLSDLSDEDLCIAQIISEKKSKYAIKILNSRGFNTALCGSPKIISRVLEQQQRNNVREDLTRDLNKAFKARSDARNEAFKDAELQRLKNEVEKIKREKSYRLN